MPLTDTDTNPIPLGTLCPDFSLTDVSTGNTVTRDSLTNQPGCKGLVVVFTCNHCPVAGRIRGHLAQTAKEYQDKGIAFLAIMPNELSIAPMNGPQEMKLEVSFFKYPFPYCFDGDNQAASIALGATVTPEFQFYQKKGSDLSLVYRGAYDNARPALGDWVWEGGDEALKAPVDGCYLRTAMDTVLNGGDVATITQSRAEGCSVKFLDNESEPAWSNSEYVYGKNLDHHWAMNRTYFMYRAVYDFLGFFSPRTAPLGNENDMTHDGGARMKVFILGAVTAVAGGLLFAKKQGKI